MKTALIALAGLAVLGGAALADPPGRIAREAPIVFTPQAMCALRLNGGAVTALGAAYEADSWSLSVRAPGLVVEQGGDLPGDDLRMERLSRIYAVDQSLQMNRWTRANDLVKRPLLAELTLSDSRGRTVCRDRLDLRP
ncbi:MAG: hypothetical protein ACFE0P_02030 [Oceanicaulis sp.]